MKTLILILMLLLTLACGRVDLNYPCNMRFAPASDNGPRCAQCFPSDSAELAFMEKFVRFWARNDPATLQDLTDATLGGNPGADTYPIFMTVFDPGESKGACGR